jgi:hypothetical protein
MIAMWEIKGVVGQARAPRALPTQHHREDEEVAHA